MADRLPPLTALRAFDAAARHMSFRKAAEELNVTPAALSFQIKSLEEHLGGKVFKRRNRSVALTEAGAALAPGSAQGFETLARAWRAARRTGDGSALTITAGPGFTAQWIAPRLHDMARDHPEISLRFVASLDLLDFDRDDIDVAIRFGYDRPAGFFAEPLLDDWVTPMMTPERAASCREPRDLYDMPTIADSSIDFLEPPLDWPHWMRAAGLDGAPAPGPRFSNVEHAIDAAVSGAGVLLGRRSMTARELATGRLVAPFRLALTTRARFSFLCRPGQETWPPIAAFRTWIRDQLACAPSAEGFELVSVETLEAP